MAKAVRKKPKPKNRKFSDQKQSERFIEAARKLGVDDPKSQDDFERAFKKIAPPKTGKPTT
jgi:hypothetical protein